MTSPTPTSGDFKILERANDDNDLDIFIGESVSEKLATAVKANCANLGDKNCLTSVKNAVDGDEVELQARGLGLVTAGDVGQVLKKGRGGLVVWIYGILAFLWKSREAGSTDPRLAHISYVHIPGTQLANIQTWTAGATATIGTAVGDAHAATIAIPNVPAPSAQTCKQDPDCPEDKERLLCSECDGAKSICRKVSSFSAGKSAG